MRVLVVGKGAREHALCWRLNQSPVVWGLYCAPGNPGTKQLAETVAIDVMDSVALAAFARERRIDLTIVGPEDPLTKGIVDEFQRQGLTIFGPTQAAAKLESSKTFAKEVMSAAKVATADWAAFDDASAARDYLSKRAGGCVVKADGLAFGKGVFVCDSEHEALTAIDDLMVRKLFGAAGERVLIEDRLAGQELSFFALCDGTTAVPLGSAQDHKPVFDGDRGPNTGGMGAYSPAPQFGPEIDARIMREIVEPVLAEMVQRGSPFCGVLFVGAMIEGDSIKVLEFNARFGDPECEALMMRFETDVAEVLMAAAAGNLASGPAPRLSSRSATSVVLASGGYPATYAKGLPITGLDRIEGGAASDAKVKWALEKTRIKVFHAGTAVRDSVLLTDGGRVLVVSALADSLKRATEAAYQAADMIEFEGKHLRRDIGHQALKAAAEILKESP
jgi:phosphoribosylamine--glycine ligase